MAEFMITYHVKTEPGEPAVPSVHCLVEAFDQTSARNQASVLCPAAEKRFPADVLVRTSVCTLEEFLSEYRDTATELAEELEAIEAQADADDA